MSTLLAFDTATERMSIALLAAGRLQVHEADGGSQAGATLIPAIQALLRQAGVGLRDLDAIAFGRGPGAFTGLRTACSVAQGLAFGASKPVLCLDTLQAVAEDARRIAATEDVWVLMDARMGEIYAARYLYQSGEVSDEASGRTGRHAKRNEGAGGCGAWRAMTEPGLYALPTLLAMFESSAPVAVAGTAIEAFGDRLPSGSALRVPGAWPRPAALMTVASQAWRAGEAVDAAEALPLYVRDKVALTTVEREAVKAAKLASA